MCLISLTVGEFIEKFKANKPIVDIDWYLYSSVIICLDSFRMNRIGVSRTLALHIQRAIWILTALKHRWI